MKTLLNRHMKLIITLFFLLLIVSCVSTKYNVYRDQNDFQNIQAGTKYTVFDKNDRKIFLNVTSVEKDSIRGTRKNQPFAIAKNDIKEVKKNKTAASVILIGGTTSLLIMTYVIADTTRKIAEDLGNAIGGQ